MPARTHGYATRPNGKENPTYLTWQGMIQRCTNPNHLNWHRYGGRGIKVYTPWLDFSKFLQDMGDRPQGLTLERIDNDGNYEPSNCRWATHQEQMQNHGRVRRLIVDDISASIAEWSRRTGIHQNTITYRIDTGWPVDLALSIRPWTTGPMPFRHHAAKLTDAQVVKMRQLRASKKLSYSILAKQFNVNISAVAAVIKRVTWRHL